MNFVADLVAVEVEIGDPRGSVTLEDLQGRSQLGDIPQRGARDRRGGCRVEGVDAVVELATRVDDGVEEERVARRFQVVVEVGQLAGRLRRGDDEPVDDAGYRHESGEVGNGRHRDDADSESPPAPSRRDHQGEPSGNGEDGQQPGGANNDVQFGETGADERSGRIDRLHRAPNEDVVECLDGGEQGSEHGEVSESRRPGAAPVRVAPRPSQLAGDRRGEQREDKCDDEQLAQPGADYGEERQAEQVVAEVTAELGDLAPDRTAVEEQQPLLPRGGRRDTDPPCEHSHDGDQQPLMGRPHSPPVATNNPADCVIGHGATAPHQPQRSADDDHGTNDRQDGELRPWRTRRCATPARR